MRNAMNAGLGRAFAQVVVLLAACATGSAVSAEYLIASLVSDHITLVGAEPETGSNLDKNRYDVLKFPDVPFDDAIHKIVSSEVAKVDSQATFKGVAFRDGLPGVESLDREDPKEIARRLVQVLGPQLQGPGRRWIVMLWPHRSQPQFKLDNVTVGHGKMSGLGYYVDQQTRIVIRTSGARDRGFLGTFAHFGIGIVDPATGAIAASEIVTAGVLRPVAGTDARHPWEALSAEQKVAQLNRLVARELRGKLPSLVGVLGAGK
jgi:hypothetical protein